MVNAGELFEVTACVQKDDKDDKGNFYFALTLANKNGSFYARYDKPFSIGSIVQVSASLKVNKGFFNLENPVIHAMEVKRVGS